MRADLENKLVLKYPEVFRDVRGDPRKTAMAWGLEVGDGWYGIIDCLCSQFVSRLRHAQGELDYLLGKEGQRVSGVLVDRQRIEQQMAKVQEELEKVPVAEQVKEKFGSLRFYAKTHSSEQRVMIDMATAMSERVCEECGGVGMKYSIGWMRTLCEEHADQAYGEKAREFREKIEEKQFPTPG